ncbi:ATP-binding protein [Actinoallomurus sp. CA-150999]|uniref:ATP-binding protein n=1 Tax=Actinoallomurus sp. CA-150999 TaxID=3239887 RepID=UPI003D8AC96B
MRLLAEALGLDEEGSRDLMRRVGPQALADGPALDLPTHPSARNTVMVTEKIEAPRPSVSTVSVDESASTPPGEPRRSPWPAPAQLPADIPDFTGRAVELHVVTSSLDSDAASARVTVVTGSPGVGKTTLALHAAHRLRHVFTDGTLFTDLRGAGTAPRDPGDVLNSLLRSLGVPGRTIPPGLADRSALYRSILADRAVLLVLDNAATSAQVRSLLPGGGPSAALVTSRAQLTGLVGATRLDLPPMSELEATALFAATAGHGRVADDDTAVTDVITSCGRLPLAVRIAGAKLASRPAWSVRHLADRLADRHRRMDELHVEDLDVRASLMLSYRGLGPAAAQAFRLLALLDYPASSLRTAAALLNVPASDAEHLLDQLLDAHLVTNPAPDRYSFHDLLRSFAKEQALREDSGDVRRRSLTRAVRASLTDLAGQVPHPRPDAVPQGTGRTAEPSRAKRTGEAVSDVEQDNLVAAIMLVTSTPELDAALAAQLLELLQRPLILSGRWDDLSRCAAAVEHVTGGWAQATAQRVRARIAIHRNERATARRLLSITLEQARATGDRPGEASSLILLGTLHGRSGDHDAAVAALEQAITVGLTINMPVHMIMAHNYAGEQYLHLDRPDTALYHLRTGLSLARDNNDEDLMAMALYLLGAAHSRLGDHHTALIHHHDALQLARTRGSAHSEAIARLHLGRTLQAAGRHDEADRALAIAVEGFRAHGDHHSAAQALAAAKSLSGTV